MKSGVNMSKEKELQDELEREWGQLDRVERMLRYLCQRINPRDLEVDDISDILGEK